jgi:hypothetical protein
MARKSKPWAVVVTCDNAARIRTEYTGEAKAYEAVRAERAAIDAGESRGIAIRVEKWESDRWVWFDQPYPWES